MNGRPVPCEDFRCCFFEDVGFVYTSRFDEEVAYGMGGLGGGWEVWVVVFGEVGGGDDDAQGYLGRCKRVPALMFFINIITETSHVFL